MTLIETIAETIGADEILDETALTISRFDNNYIVNINPLDRSVMVDTDIVDLSDSDEDLDPHFIEVANFMTSCSGDYNITYYLNTDARLLTARFSFTYTNTNELTFFLLNSLHALQIAGETYRKVMHLWLLNDSISSFDVESAENEAMAEHLREHLALNILYVHGFRSSGNSSTAACLRELLPECSVISPDLPADAHEAMTMLENIVDEQEIDVVVGTSMGGMLAQKLRGIPKVLVNPAFNVSETFRRNIGTVTYFSPRADGRSELDITPEIADSYLDLERTQFDDITARERSITVGIFGLKDDVVNCSKLYLEHYDAALYFDGAHRLDPTSIRSVVLPALAKVYRNAQLRS